MNYRADIDGLRAIAVIAVIAFHSGLGLSGGFAGVDVFFVISGFLITRIIVREISENRFSYLEFWARRARRLIPAAVATILTVIVGGYFILLPDDYRELGQSSIAVSTGLANFYFWRESGYFDGPSELKPLLHTWSLAVEEQFYMVIPLLLAILFRIAGMRHLLFLIVLAILSFIWSIYASGEYPDASFYLIPSRAFELLLGGIISEIVPNVRIKRKTAELISVIGMTLILISFVAISRLTVFPGYSAAIPCLGTGLVILGNSGVKTTMCSILSIQPMVFVGLISYSLYLWHWPVFAFTRYLSVGEPALGMTILMLLFSFLLAVLSWKYIETPFRIGSRFQSRRHVFKLSMAMLGLIFGIGLFIHIGDGLSFRFSPEVQSISEACRDRNPQREIQNNLLISVIEKSGLPRLGTNTDTAPKLLVIGDSHADALMPAFHELASEYQLPAVCITRSATIPLIYDDSGPRSKFAEFYKTIRLQIKMTPSISDVVLIGRWMEYDEEMNSYSAWKTNIDSLRSKFINIWVILQVPEAKTEVPRALALAKHWDWPKQSVSYLSEEYFLMRSRSDSLFAGLNNSVKVLDLSAFFFQDSDRARIEKDGKPLYIDSHHLSTFGARELKYLLKPIFEAIKGYPYCLN